MDLESHQVWCQQLTVWSRFDSRPAYLLMDMKSTVEERNVRLSVDFESDLISLCMSIYRNVCVCVCLTLHILTTPYYT